MDFSVASFLSRDGIVNFLGPRARLREFYYYYIRQELTSYPYRGKIYNFQ